MGGFNAFAKGLVGGFSTGTKAWARYQENQQRATQMEAQAEVGEKFKKFYADEEANAAIPPPADAAGVATGKAAAAANEPDLAAIGGPVPESVGEASGAGMDGGAVDTPAPAEGVSAEAPSPDAGGVPKTAPEGEAIAETGGVKGIAAKDPDDIAQMASDAGAATGSNEKNAPPTGKSWYTLMKSVERSYFSRGLVKQGIAAREALAGRMTQGYSDNLKRANSAMSSQDLHGVARYMTKAQTFSPDGTEKRYTVENGKVVETSISEKTGKVVGRNEVTSDNMKSRIANTLTGKEYLEHSDRATRTNIAEEAADMQVEQFYASHDLKSQQFIEKRRNDRRALTQGDRRLDLAETTIGNKREMDLFLQSVKATDQKMDKVRLDLAKRRQGVAEKDYDLRAADQQIREQMAPLSLELKRVQKEAAQFGISHKNEVFQAEKDYRDAVLRNDKGKMDIARQKMEGYLKLTGAQAELAKAKAEAERRDPAMKATDVLKMQKQFTEYFEKNWDGFATALGEDKVGAENEAIIKTSMGAYANRFMADSVKSGALLSPESAAAAAMKVQQGDVTQTTDGTYYVAVGTDRIPVPQTMAQGMEAARIATEKKQSDEETALKSKGAIAPATPALTTGNVSGAIGEESSFGERIGSLYDKVAGAVASIGANQRALRGDIQSFAQTEIGDLKSDPAMQDLANRPQGRARLRQRILNDWAAAHPDKANAMSDARMGVLIDEMINEFSEGGGTAIPQPNQPAQ